MAKKQKRKGPPRARPKPRPRPKEPMGDLLRFELLIPRKEREAAERLAEKLDRSLASLIRVLLADAVSEARMPSCTISKF